MESGASAGASQAGTRARVPALQAGRGESGGPAGQRSGSRRAPAAGTGCSDDANPGNPSALIWYQTKLLFLQSNLNFEVQNQQ